MSNRFRYRVWDKNKKQFYFEDYYLDGDGDLFTVEGTREGNVIKYASDPEDLIIQQCTGLKDKNGKLIFEGDVIKILDNYDLYGQLAGEKREVIFGHGGFRVKAIYNNTARGNWLEEGEDHQVIGNIFENPDLLEEEK